MLKEDRNGGRKGKEGRTRRGDLRERHKNTRTQGKRTQMVTNFSSNNNICFFSYNLSFIEDGEEERNETTRRFKFPCMKSYTVHRGLDEEIAS